MSETEDQQTDGRQEPAPQADGGWLCPILRHPARDGGGERPAGCPADKDGIVPAGALPACRCRGPAGKCPD